jgi:hypothetical protein
MRQDLRARMRRLAALLLAFGVTLPADAALAAPELRVRDGLVFAQLDGTPVPFRPDVRVRCGRWAPHVRVPSIHVDVGGRRGGTAPRWELHAVAADVKRRPVVRLPNAFVFDRPEGALLFAVDDRGNELNSDTEESRGRIRFTRVSCGRRLRLAFRIDARLGSELSDLPPLTVRGSFSASASR